MRAYDIEWDIDIEEAFEKLDTMTLEEAAAALDIQLPLYSKMNTIERRDFAYDRFCHNHTNLADFIGVPNKVDIPEEIAKEGTEAISDWLTDEFGWCHRGFRLS